MIRLLSRVAIFRHLYSYRVTITDRSSWVQMMVGTSSRTIARDLGFDKKTVNANVERIYALGIDPAAKYCEALIRLAALSVDNGKAKPSMVLLEPLEDEIRDLIVGDRTASTPCRCRDARYDGYRTPNGHR